MGTRACYMHSHMDTQRHACTHAQTYIHMGAHTQTYIHIRACMHSDIFANVHTDKHTVIDTCKHRHVHKDMHRCTPRCTRAHTCSDTFTYVGRHEHTERQAHMHVLTYTIFGKAWKKERNT